MIQLEPEELMPRNSLLVSMTVVSPFSRKKLTSYLPCWIPTKMVTSIMIYSLSQLEDPCLLIDKLLAMVLSLSLIPLIVEALLPLILEFAITPLPIQRSSLVKSPRMKHSLSSFPTLEIKPITEKSPWQNGMITTLPSLLQSITMHILLISWRTPGVSELYE